MANVLYFQDMPDGYEIEKIRLVKELPESSELSFTDGIYEEIYNYVKEKEGCL